MRARLSLAAAVVLVLGILSSLAVASGGLSMASAESRSDDFARHTCHHDGSCVEYGVLSCRRQGPGAVLCRIYDERRTRVQGRYRCERLVRVSLEPLTDRRPITGLGSWHC